MNIYLKYNFLIFRNTYQLQFSCKIKNCINKLILNFSSKLQNCLAYKILNHRYRNTMLVNPPQKITKIISPQQIRKPLNCPSSVLCSSRLKPSRRVKDWENSGSHRVPTGINSGSCYGLAILLVPQTVLCVAYVPST